MRKSMTRMELFYARTGKRLGLMSAVTLLLAILCAGQSARQRAPAGGARSPKVPSNWSEFHRQNMVRWNPHETILNVKNVQNLGVKWTYATGNGVFSSPAVVNGVVYIGSADQNVYALDAESGGKLWSFATGDVVNASPAVADGMVYIGSEDGYIYALSTRTGTLTWKRYIGSFSGSPASSTAVENGIVYVGEGKYEGPTIYALRAKTGRKVWESDSGWVSIDPAIANGIVYFATINGPLEAFDSATGTVLWYSNPGSAAVTNGVVYVSENGLSALDARTGAVLWNYPAGSGSSSPAVANGVVYFAAGSEESFLYALSAKNGTKLWRRSLASTTASSPAVANGVVYVGSDDHNLYAFNAKTGAKLWSYNTGSYVGSSPVIVNGVVYIGADNGNVYAFGLKK